MGASGLMGSHALRALADRPGIEIRAVHHRRPVRVTAGNITTVCTDLSVPGHCAEAIGDSDYVLVFCGILAPSPVVAADPVAPAIANMRLAVNALETAHRASVRKCVWLSSTTGYPDIPGQIDEDRMFEGNPPGNWYALGWSMRFVETLCQAYGNHPNRPMPVIALRPTLAYGEFDHFEGDAAHFLPALIRRVVNRENPIEIWGDGTQTRNLIYAGDVAEAAILALSRLDRSEALNIGGAKSHSVNDVLGSIIALDGFDDARVVHVPGRPSILARREFNTQKAAEILGFQPATPLKEGLRRTIAWYRGETSRVC